MTVAVTVSVAVIMIVVNLLCFSVYCCYYCWLVLVDNNNNDNDNDINNNNDNNNVLVVIVLVVIVCRTEREHVLRARCQLQYERKEAARRVRDWDRRGVVDAKKIAVPSMRVNLGQKRQRPSIP